jgi:hypothetical protein
MVFYGILDVLAKPVFLFIHLFLLSRENLSALQLQSGKYSETANAVNYADREKHTTAYPGGAANVNTANVNANGTKKGMFGRKGKYDAAAHPVTEHSALDDGAAPRRSEATAVSQ